MGTWAIPFTRRRLTAVIDILKAGPVPASEAEAKFADFIGDDRQSDLIEALIQIDEGETDIRWAVVKFLRHMLVGIEEGRFGQTIMQPSLARKLDANIRSGTPLSTGQVVEEGLEERLRKVLPKLEAMPFPKLDTADILRRAADRKAGTSGPTVH